MSLKYHVLHFIVEDIEKQMEKDKKQDPPAKTPFIDRWIKWQLMGREEDGYPVYQENFLRQGVKVFPFPESQLFKMLVANFSHCTNYGEGQTASEYINGAFNGQRGFKDHETCDSCGQEGAQKKCSTCKSADYCDQVALSCMMEISTVCFPFFRRVRSSTGLFTRSIATDSGESLKNGKQQIKNWKRRNKKTNI